MKWQLKMLYEYNNPGSFFLIIVDNSNPSEEETLKCIVEPYQLQFNNVSVIRNELSSDPLMQKHQYLGSHPHAHGLTVIRDNCGASEYVLFQDPDFFWVIPGYLEFLEKFLNEGNVAVGAPYPDKMGLGHPWFPALFGCAHRLGDIKKLSFYPDIDPERNKKIVEENPELNPLSRDVGFELRQTLSSPDVVNFVAFDQVFVGQLKKFIGVHSFEFRPRAYYHEKTLVAFHLFRGSFTSKITQTKDGFQLASETPEAWQRIRARYGEFFYRVLSDELTYRLASQVFAQPEELPSGLPKIVIDRNAVEASTTLRTFLQDLNLYNNS